MVTAPVATSVTAGAAPRYGTCSTLVPAIMFISSPANCCGLPTPEEENDSLPALALAKAISSCGLCTGVLVATTTTQGTIPISAIGVSSRRGS